MPARADGAECNGARPTGGIVDTRIINEKSHTDERRSRGGGAVVRGLAIGLVSAVVGLAPWLVSGARLPLQNLWQRDVMPDAMPVALLPVSQYYATRILVLLLVGGALAGVAVRLLRRVSPITGWATGLGVLCVQVLAAIQSFIVVAEGLGVFTNTADSRGWLYLAGMLGGTIVSMLMAQGLYWLISRTAVGPAALGIALAAVPFASWLLTVAVLFAGPAGAATGMSVLYRWLPALIVGAALGWCGVQPLRRLGVWVAGLLMLLVTPAVFTAASNALGMRVLDGDLREMAQVAAEIFPLALGLGVAPTALALLLAAAIVAVRWMARRRRASGRGPGLPGV